MIAFHPPSLPLLLLPPLHSVNPRFVVSSLAVLRSGVLSAPLTRPVSFGPVFVSVPFATRALASRNTPAPLSPRPSHLSDAPLSASGFRITNRRLRLRLRLSVWCERVYECVYVCAARIPLAVAVLSLLPATAAVRVLSPYLLCFLSPHNAAVEGWVW